VENNLH
jgi:hypothetical protein